jgi:hypothetical protein
MITPARALAHYGDPTTERFMVLFDVPASQEIGAIPKRVYCNKDLKNPLALAFTLLVDRGLAPLVRTWDGCFQLRKQRGSTSTSLHSWGLAVDLNAAWNQLGHTPTMDPRIVACFEESGFDWGGHWQRSDGMHFQLREIPK